MKKITDTFKCMLLLSMGKSIDNIHPYRLKQAPNLYAGFERMTVKNARKEGFTIPEDYKPKDTLYIMRVGPAILRDWSPTWMFEAAFEPVPQKTEEETVQTLTEEMQTHFNKEADLNTKAYALSVELIKKCDGSIHHKAKDGHNSSTYIPLGDVDPVELIITEASLNESEEIVLKGYSYYNGIEHEWTCCDANLGMDILNFILLYHKEQEI